MRFHMFMLMSQCFYTINPVRHTKVLIKRMMTCAYLSQQLSLMRLTVLKNFAEIRKKFLNMQSSFLIYK